MNFHIVNTEKETENKNKEKENKKEKRGNKDIKEKDCRFKLSSDR